MSNELCGLAQLRWIWHCMQSHIAWTPGLFLWGSNRFKHHHMAQRVGFQMFAWSLHIHTCASWKSFLVCWEIVQWLPLKHPYLSCGLNKHWERVRGIPCAFIIWHVNCLSKRSMCDYLSWFYCEDEGSQLATVDRTFFAQVFLTKRAE